MPPLLEVSELSKAFPLRGATRMLATFRGGPQAVQAVSDVSFNVAAGETLGLIGESGCGKSTVARCITRVIDPTSGTVLLNGQNIAALDKTAMRRARHDVQMVFQDPTAALNPRLTVRRMVEEPLRLEGKLTSTQRRERLFEVMDDVGLGRDLVDRYPHEMSGGQRQRVNIARAIATHPRFVVLDEPTSALDVSLRSRIILLLEHLRKRLGLAYLFISHDIATVKYLAQRIAVMYLGRIVEEAPGAELFARPAHPYTRALLSAVPVPDPDAATERFPLSGEIPSPLAIPTGCALRGRCPLAQPICAEPVPLRDIAPGRKVACHLA
ncbi:MAG: ABC transporter ATP-binding protein [Methylobacteriaceae bacterium]|nr:ABC transporter ATP-binding protein [Methylobacteriaceae bacterium]